MVLNCDRDFKMLQGNSAAGQASFYLLVVFSLHSLALGSRNASRFSPRTFSANSMDYMDPSLFGSGTGSGSGSGFQPEPVRKHHGSDRHPLRHYFISEEAGRFLRSFLTTVFVPTVYTLVFVIGVPLNLVAAVMFVYPLRPRKPAVIYMLNLACADLLFGLLLPFKIVYHYHGNNWTFGPVMCKVVTASFYSNMYCSVLLMACIATDRLLAVVYPINSLTWRSRRTAWAVCVSMWLLALAGVAPLLASDQTAYLPRLGITTCHDVQDFKKLKSFYHYFFPVYSSIFFFTPLLVTVVSYARIIRTLAASNVENRSKKTRAVVMAVVVLVIFVVCFTPANIILMVHYVTVNHTSGDSTYRAYLLAMCSGSLSCSLDPVLYYFGSSQCRKQVLDLFRCRRPHQIARGSHTQSTSTRTSGPSEKRHSSETGKQIKRK
ncbi:proteinase-activated receptor 1-like [Stigmatopora nigra]